MLYINYNINKFINNFNNNKLILIALMKIVIVFNAITVNYLSTFVLDK